MEFHMRKTIPKAEHPEEFPGRGPTSSPKIRVDSGGAEGVYEGRAPRPGETPNRGRGNFYARTPPKSTELRSEGELRSGGSERQSSDDVEHEKEYLFPMEGKMGHKPSFSENVSTLSRPKTESSLSTTPKSHNYSKGRSYSISVTDPVCRSTYESLPQSPAASFLAQFAAHPDAPKENVKFEDGSVVDKYRLGRILGRGSFSECREAVNMNNDPQGAENESDPRVAMKIVKGDEHSRQILLDFDRELVIWKRLQHKNILPLIDCLHMDEARVAISPIADNGTLLDYISKNGAISEALARILFRQICAAVYHLHHDHDIVHRDIKLDNILLDANLHPYLCDFGLSEFIQDKRGATVPLEAHDQGSDSDSGSGSKSSKARTEDEIFCKGSLWYLPPEELDCSLSKRSESQENLQTGSGGDLRKKGDVWALGVVLYAMVSGRLPFTDDYLPRLQVAVSNGDYTPISDKCSPSLKDLVRKLLTVNVDERPTIDEVMNDPWVKA